MNTRLHTNVIATPIASFTPVRSGTLQRKCACGGTPGPTGECAACRKKREATLQRAAVNPGPINSVPPMVHDVLRSPGQPLSQATRAFMEPRFGHDFSQVRIHADRRAAESAQAVNALAYTVGHAIAFAPQQYTPGTPMGDQLLAHELVHTIQNSPSGVGGNLVVASPSSAAEQQAEAAARTVSAGQAAIVKPGNHKGLLLRAPSSWDPEVTYPGWRSVLPPCPCTDAEAARNPARWQGGMGGCPDFFHPGAVTGYRSTRGYRSSPGTSHGQQCCYDAAGALITSGAGAGTPDVWSPVTDFFKHQSNDVAPWFVLGWATYNKYWIPDQGRNCNAGDFPLPSGDERPV